MKIKWQNLSNKDWSKGLRENFSEIFERIFREMSPKLCRFALTYVMDVNVAEDIVQDAFLHLLSVISSLPEDTDVCGYLYSSVKNSCLNYYKHLRVEDSHQTKLTEALIYVKTSNYEQNDVLLEQVQRALQCLPEQQKRVLELKIFQGMSYREIAAELQVSEGTVHTHVKRAYKFIRDFLPVYSN